MSKPQRYFSKPFLSHCILSLSVYAMEKRRILLKIIEFSLYNLYGDAPAQEPLPQGS